MPTLFQQYKKAANRKYECVNKKIKLIKKKITVIQQTFVGFFTSGTLFALLKQRMTEL